MQTYLFYDIETTGLNFAFDQVLHFAAIRTDAQLNEIERYELKVKLNSDVVPAPEAMLTHRMRLDEINEGISEYEAIKLIHQWLNTPGTISVGYNSISFDDEFLRFSFYRNLLTPYTHQYENNCGRMDIYPLAIMYCLFKTQIINWPKDENNKISLRLENINAANQFVVGRSHHAMIDVEVTLALARKMFKEREMWNYLKGGFVKREEHQRLRRYQDDSALMILGRIGADNFFQSQVLYLGDHLYYGNPSLWLRLDALDFSSIPPDLIIENTWVIKKKLGEPGFLLPLEDRYLHYLTEERKMLANKNRQFLRDNPDILMKISNYHKQYQYPKFMNVDVSASLYLDDFWSAGDLYFCKLFHAATASDKARLITTTNNQRLLTLGMRILARHFSNLLDLKQFETYSLYLNDSTVIDYKGKTRLTKAQALQTLNELKNSNTLDHEQIELAHVLEQLYQ